MQQSVPCVYCYPHDSRYIDIVNAQLYWYGIASHGVDAIYQFANASKCMFFAVILIVSSWLAVLNLFRTKREIEKLFVAFCGVTLVLGSVALRYILLRNHSDIHVFFVDRSLFVFAGTVSSS